MESGVVVVLDVVPDTAAQLRIGGEAHAVNDVGLQGMEERLHVGVVARRSA